MPYSDKEKQSEYLKNYQRKRRSEGLAPKLTGKTQERWKVKTATDLLNILEASLNDLLDTEGLDICVRSRAVSNLLSVGVRLVEAATIESRIKIIEDRLDNAVTEISEP